MTEVPHFAASDDGTLYALTEEAQALLLEIRVGKVLPEGGSNIGDIDINGVSAILMGEPPFQNAVQSLISLL